MVSSLELSVSKVLLLKGEHLLFFEVKSLMVAIVL